MRDVPLAMNPLKHPFNRCRTNREASNKRTRAPTADSTPNPKGRPDEATKTRKTCSAALVVFQSLAASQGSHIVPTAKLILFVMLGLFGAAFALVWVNDLMRRRHWLRPTWFHAFVGFITDFLDTLGIGSFAVTTTLYRPARVVLDERIPGTLNVGHCLPTIVQALIYITIVEVDITTLLLTIAASVVGATFGAGVVAHWPRRQIQVGMGLALLVAALFILARLVNLLPAGGDATGLDGVQLLAACVGNFIFGALMTIGVGAYAPIMVMISILGMNPKTAFPIMMGSCAFLMPVAGIRFIRADAYDRAAALGLTLAGIPAVLIAALLVKELPLDVVRWMVVMIVVYTALAMLAAAVKEAFLRDRPPSLESSETGPRQE